MIWSWNNRAQPTERNQFQTVLPHILAIHAWGGCDTTTAVFGHGKCRIHKLAQRSQENYTECLIVKADTSDTGLYTSECQKTVYELLNHNARVSKIGPVIASVLDMVGKATVIYSVDWQGWSVWLNNMVTPCCAVRI